jgi:hypothetical protein
VQAFERLAGTRITTNIATGGLETTRGFGLIEGWEIVRRTRGGRMVSVAVTLSDWLFRAVLAKSVLTISRDYFRLRKPWNGGSMNWRASIAAVSPNGRCASTRCI